MRLIPAASVTAFTVIFSFIDWSKSLADIDEQLFDKYGLAEEERKYINGKIEVKL
ncbi:MAG: hypothetical protein J5930_01140 [Treponema sp.]|nr:hypothetical protein [Treponema sp.]